MTGKIDTVDASEQVQMSGMQSTDQSSPMTPYVHSLQGLNDRLASYIESKKILESENCHLKAVLKSSKEARDREAVMKKKLYADDLAEKDKCLNEVAMEKAKLEIAYHETVVDNGNLKDLIQKLRSQLEETQMNLKNEIIARIDSDNTAKSREENLTLELQVHVEQLNMTRQQVDTSEIYSHLGDEYNGQLQDSLQELREQFGNEIRSNRNEMQAFLENKLKKERDSLYRENKSLSSALELSSKRSERSSERIGELEANNAKLSAQIRNLEMALAGERERNSESAIDFERLGKEFEFQLKKYQVLMDAKGALALEVATYKQLLRNGEQDSTTKPRAKRPRSDSIPKSMPDPVMSSSTASIEKKGEVQKNCRIM